jgi:rhodanese-related sulfurtransferase
VPKFTACFGRDEIAGIAPMSPVVLISITDPGTQEASLIPGAWDAVLRLQFWDVEHPIQGYEPASDKQLKLIYEFIRSHYDKNIFAHCEAGVSRSSAIRAYLRKRGWDYWNNNSQRTVYPNKYLLRSLEALDYPIGYDTQTAHNTTEQKA